MLVNLKTRFRAISPNTYWREILAVLMLLLAVIFFRSERKELRDIIPYTRRANPIWLFIGLGITIIYIFFQAGIYKKCFSSIGLSLNWGKSIILFLKRNFISVFLPAGGVSALAYSPSEIRKAGFSKPQVHQASGLFGFAGLLTVFIAGVPIIIYTVVSTNQFKNSWIGLLGVLGIVIALFAAVRSIRQKGRLYKFIDKKFPSFTPSMDELFAANVDTTKFAGAIAFSLGVELCGIAHIIVAMLALGVHVSISASAAAYIIAVLMMVVSPFLRGLGAVELSMVYVLEQFGYNTAQALAITVLYRVFEFWLPMLFGLLSFAWKGRKVFLRLAPALLAFMLGITNIISVVTPPIRQRLDLLREYIPLSAVHASNILVLFIGLSLLVTSAFLLRGLRNAWLIALTLSVFSLVGHLTKALDYEEAVIAAVTMVVLILTASQYRIRSSNKWMQDGLKIAAISFAAVLLFGFISFYYIDKKHFAVDFTWKESLLHTFRIFLLVEDTTLNPVTHFGHEFILLIRTLGFMTWGFLLFSIIKPHLVKHEVNENYKEKANFLLSQFGNSSTDYFKLYKDKLHFFSDQHEAFIAYRIARGFAIVLEEPVCAEENKFEVLMEFDRHCRKMGLKPAFYRVDENSLTWFNQLKKQKILIGQEAILEINNFSMEGKDKKAFRNALNSLQKKGYAVATHKAPQDIAFLQKLKSVSDEWLENFNKKELVFSQGMFNEKELLQQDIITLQDTSGSVKAFLNIIPDYAEDECTYDLIRKTNDAPGGCMDALLV
ncbi:MAG: flippase-like domain-containing protein, partial [Chitinophagaceae bacterium]